MTAAKDAEYFRSLLEKEYKTEAVDEILDEFLQTGYAVYIKNSTDAAIEAYRWAKKNQNISRREAIAALKKMTRAGIELMAVVYGSYHIAIQTPGGIGYHMLRIPDRE